MPIAVGTVFDFIKKPSKLWQRKDLSSRRLVLKLAFSQNIAYSKDRGFGTEGLSLPFKAMAANKVAKGGMVEDTGIEPATFCLQSRRSTN